MNEHTPGPWRYKEEFTGSGYVVASGRTIAVAENVWGADVNSIEEANARLIAAAPELLEALQELWACAETYDEFNDPQHDWYPLGHQVQAVIARAEGGK